MSKQDEINAFAARFTDIPLNFFEIEYDALVEKDVVDAVVSALNGIAQRAVLLGEYLENRKDMRGHESSAKQAVKTLNKVRKAMGYTYPQSFTF